MDGKASRQPHRIHLMLTSNWLAWDRLQEKECSRYSVTAVEHTRTDRRGELAGTEQRVRSVNDSWSITSPL